MSAEERRALAAHVRAACIEAALRGYEDASVAGLCGEGALEVAISAIRKLELDDLIVSAADKDRQRGTTPRLC